MKSANGSPYLTPAEACELAGVGPTTLKRWADAGVLAHVKTAGGHRRFVRSELERFLSRSRRVGPPDTTDPNPWIGKLLGSLPHEVEGELLFARARLGSWHQVADELGGVLREIGERWSRGELTILDEHIASERLARGLARIGEALPSRPGAPRALLACIEGDEHSLGLGLVELCLRELGWATLWAGARTPIAELERVIGTVEIDLIALSASSQSQEAAALARACSSLARACEARGIALAIGGNGAWPETAAGYERFRDFASFHRYLGKLRPPLF